jgi:ribosomal protein S27AE
MTRDEMDRKLFDLKTRQDAGERMLCPRCGRNVLKVPLTHNAQSRHVDLFVCDECGMTEAMLDMMRNPLPQEQWAAFHNPPPPPQK